MWNNGKSRRLIKSAWVVDGQDKSRPGIGGGPGDDPWCHVHSTHTHTRARAHTLTHTHTHHTHTHTHTRTPHRHTHTHTYLIVGPQIACFPSISTQNCVCTSPVHHNCYMSRPSNSSWFGNAKIIWWVLQVWIDPCILMVVCACVRVRCVDPG